MLRVGCTVSEAFPHFVERIPTFAGVKFTHDDLADYTRCLKLAGEKYEVFFGRDEMLLQAIRAGARSAVGSTYNFATPLCHRIVQSEKSGRPEDAQNLQLLATEAIQSMVRAGGLPGIQGVLRISGIDCGPMRLPLRALYRTSLEALREELDALEYFNAIRPA
jgi:N-acetylneuraminate lyase